MLKQAVSLSLMSLACLPDLAGAGGRRVRVGPPQPLLVQCPPRLWIAPPCLPTFDVIAPDAVPSAAIPAPLPSTPLKKPSVLDEPAVPGSAAGERPPETTAMPKAKDDERIRPVGELTVPAAPSKPPIAPAISIPEVKPTPSPAAPKIPLLLPKPPGDNGLPPLAVPTPADPNGRGTSNYPAKPARVQIVVVAAGETVTSATRAIGFYNRSQNDRTLTVQGKQVKLPKQSYLNLELPPKFTWTLDDGAEQTTEVPSASPGVEIVIRY